jgi:alkylation response protein AidB-like acyl-CoA dehydrogenase
MSVGFFSMDHEALPDAVRTYVAREVTPNLASWDQERRIPRRAWTRAGEQGFLGLLTPERLGGTDTHDFRYRCVFMDELAAVGAALSH